MMQQYELIEKKLEQFIKKYYYNELIKGGILFLATGLLYFIIILTLEYFLWLSPFFREILFWAFILVEISLFSKFIIYPVTKLFKITKGIDHQYASKVIGRSFPEVNDRLTNILQLRTMEQDSDLVLQSIEQKAAQIKPVPFQNAIDFRSNIPYLKYAFFPILIMLLIAVTGKYDLFTDSYERVVNYKQAYEPPAPFKIKVLNDSLVTTDQDPFTVEAKTIGDVSPESMRIHMDNGRSFLMKSKDNNSFHFDIEQLKKSRSFYLSANKVRSKNYDIKVLSVPMVDNIKLMADVPEHTGMSDKQVDGTGNIEIPEGTKLTWLVNTTATEQLNIELNDSVHDFKRENKRFEFSKKLFNSSRYVLSSSNQFLKDYDRLDYSIQVMKDELPEIKVQMKKDSLDADKKYFSGTVSDDYGISRISIVYYPIDNEKKAKRIVLKKPGATFARFYYTFPNERLELLEGKTYGYYFKTLDNDGVNGYKTTRSSTYFFRKRTREEQKEEQLQRHSESIENMEKNLEELKKNESNLEELKKIQREKNKLDYADKKRIQDFIKRQKQQQDLMERFNKSMKENLSKQNDRQEDPQKKDLLKRLESNEENIKKNEDLLEQLDKYNKKLEDEDLQKDLEAYEKETEKQKRNLEEILELTKRYYVEEKTRKITKELERLAKEQKELADEKREKESLSQDSLNKDFDKVSKELDSLQKENKKLKEPYPLPDNKEEKKSVKKEQKDAKKSLEESEESSSKEQQQQSEQNKANRTLPRK